MGFLVCVEKYSTYQYGTGTRSVGKLELTKRNVVRLGGE